MSSSQDIHGESRRARSTLVASPDLAEAMVHTINQPLLILDSALCVREANPAFYELFQVDENETWGQPLYELGNGQWDVPELRELLERVLPEGSVVRGYPIEHVFPAIGRRVMSLNAQRVPAGLDRTECILLAISDRTEAENAKRELEGHKEFHEKLIDSTREALLVLDTDLRVVRANKPFYDTFRVAPSDTEGHLVYELGNRQWNLPRLRELLEAVLPHDDAFDDVEVEHQFETIGWRAMLLNGRRLDHLDLILLAIRDVTEQRRVRQQQETLMGELHHRMKNVLTSVGALASRTARDSASLEEFLDGFHSRLNGLGRVQELLIRAPEQDVRLSELLRMEMRAHGGQEGANFRLEGPELSVPSRAVQPLAMAVHELATNAVKYGALGSPEGQVEISWTRGEDEPARIRFRWREVGVRLDHATVAGRKGYGSRVLDSTFRHSLDGSSELTLHPDGAEFTAEFRLD